MDIREELKKNSGIILVLTTLFVYVLAKMVLPAQSWLDLLAGMVIFLEMMLLVGMEVREGVKKHGWKNELADTLIAVIVALVIWFGAQFLLNTSTPISAVVSCSMLNELQRGDFVIVQGSTIRAPEIEMTMDELVSMVNGPFIVFYNGRNYTFDKPFNRYCYYHRSEEICNAYLAGDEEFVEYAGPAVYHHTVCDVKYADTQIIGKMRCLDYAEIKGQRVRMADKNSDIIVYSPRPTDLYSVVGDIVHRSVARIKVGNETYYITGGDNNPVLDTQTYDYYLGKGNFPPSDDNVRGKVIARVPYLGYLKLFVFGFWKEDEQCGWMLKR